VFVYVCVCVFVCITVFSHKLSIHHRRLYCHTENIFKIYQANIHSYISLTAPNLSKHTYMLRTPDNKLYQNTCTEQGQRIWFCHAYSSKVSSVTNLKSCVYHS